jgi:hypothetical protein
LSKPTKKKLPYKENPNKDDSRWLKSQVMTWLDSARPILDKSVLSRAEPSRAESRQH